MKKVFILLSFALLLSLLSAVNTGNDRIIGKWYTENNKSIVEIYKQGSAYFGKIVWLKEPNEENGQTKKDVKNPDAKMRNQSLINLVILHKLEAKDTEHWADGKIYDPKNGKTYDVKATLTDKDNLEIRGFIGISLVGRTTRWKRVS